MGKIIKRRPCKGGGLQWCMVEKNDVFCYNMTEGSTPKEQEVLNSISG